MIDFKSATIFHKPEPTDTSSTFHKPSKQRAQKKFKCFLNVLICLQYVSVNKLEPSYKTCCSKVKKFIKDNPDLIKKNPSFKFEIESLL